MRCPAMAVVPAIPGKTGFAVYPRPALQVRGARALDDHEARADARDEDPPDRAAVLGAALQAARQERHAAAHVGQIHERALFDGRRCRAFDLRQRTAQVVLAQFRVQRGERLLPHERDPGVDEREHAGEDQHERERAQGTLRPRRAPAPREARATPRDRDEGNLRHRHAGLWITIVAEPTSFHRASPARRRTAVRES